MTTIPVTAVAALRGSAIGTGVVEAVFVLGTNGAATVCDGTMDFDGSLRGRIGTFKAAVSSWKSGGDAAFTSAGFTLVAGSGTGDLSNLVEVDLTIQRDETVVQPEGQQPVGAYFGTVRFEGDQSPTQVGEESKDLSDYTVAELFRMEQTGDITTEELAAELERRN